MREIIQFIIGKADWMKTITGISVIAVFASMVYQINTSEIPDKNREIVIHMLGIVEGALMAIVGYYFGSSKGSQEKQQMLNKQNETK